MVGRIGELVSGFTVVIFLIRLGYGLANCETSGRPIYLYIQTLYLQIKFMAESNVIKKSSGANNPSPVGCTSFKLRQLSRRVTQHYEKYFSGTGIKITQYSLLSHIAHLGPVMPGELARKMDMGPSTLTRNLQPLVTAGWVEVNEGADGRSRMVTLTQSGQALYQDARRNWRAAQTALNQKLGKGTVAALHDLLDQGLHVFHDEDALE